MAGKATQRARHCMPIADLGDIAIDYRAVPGAAGRTPLVFLHEGLGSAGLWRDFPDKLARRLTPRIRLLARWLRWRVADGARAAPPRRGVDVLPGAMMGASKPVLVVSLGRRPIALIRRLAARGGGTVLMVTVLVEPRPWRRSPASQSSTRRPICASD
jgi:hypothetical protein